MTPDEIAAERGRFEKIAPHCGFPCPKPVAGVAYTFTPTPFAYASTNDGWQLWMKRAEIARAEQAELRAEVERLRAENAELAEIKRAWGMAAKDL